MNFVYADEPVVVFSDHSFLLGSILSKEQIFYERQRSAPNILFHSFLTTSLCRCKSNPFCRYASGPPLPLKLSVLGPRCYLTVDHAHSWQRLVWERFQGTLAHCHSIVTKSLVWGRLDRGRIECYPFKGTLGT